MTLDIFRCKVRWQGGKSEWRGWSRAELGWRQISWDCHETMGGEGERGMSCLPADFFAIFSVYVEILILISHFSEKKLINVWDGFVFDFRYIL